ncbi:Wadjet anti-phage system protein JetA family protein [Calderihabitans maritimus]|uniref:TIGR02677 family protein n=1 Tax=Calderihabitans maritimus TaxID=1246530 RepID=A0A1Z5HV44_9FIRM|nr:Wadjet anti-phage system protein JetA family protein [Calderihabitans maritimus]GAW93201.1 hypothetical protein Desgi_3812 [Calderihabitans maritimus]
MSRPGAELFLRIPPTLFSVFAGQLKEVYADLLLLVYEQYRRTIYTLPRELIIDLFTEYLESLDEAVWHLEEEEYQEEVAKSARERAFQLLRRLVDAGWIVQEQHFDYTFKLTLPDYAVGILETLDKIRTGYRMEFKGRVLSIFQNLTGEEGFSYVALHQAYESTGELIDGLKRLNHSIKHYTEKLLEAEDARAILSQIFDEYQVKVLGEQYYRLKTSEHISKYRTAIIRRVRDWQSNRPQILNQAALMVEEKQAPDRLTAENMIYGWLDFIEKSFTQMDELLEEIDYRNALYARAAAERLRFQLRHGRGIGNQLSTVLAYLAELARRWGEKALTPEEISRYICLFPQRVVDEFSPKKPPAARQPHRPEPLAAISVSTEVRSKKLSRFGKRVAQEVTVEQINHYVKRILGDRETMPLHEVPLETPDQWVRLIYIILFSRSRRALYRLEGKRGETVTLKGGQVEVPNLVIKRKEKQA